MVPVGARRPVQAVPVGHEQGAVAAGLGAALGPVPRPAGARAPQPHRPRRRLGGQRVAVVQDGGLALAVAAPAPFDAAEHAVELLPLLPGGRRGAELVGLLDGRLVGVGGEGGGVAAGGRERVIGSLVDEPATRAAAIGGAERAGVGAAALLDLGVEAAVHWPSRVGDVWGGGGGQGVKGQGRERNREELSSEFSTLVVFR